MSEALHRAKTSLQRGNEAEGGVPLDRKVLLMFALSAACLMVMGVVSYRSVVNSINQANWVDHTHQVLAASAELLSTMTDGETGERGFVITGNNLYLEPYNAATDKIAAKQQELRHLTRDSPSQQRDLDALDRLVAERLSIFQQAIDLRRNQGFPAAQALTSANRGKQVHDRIRALVAKIEAEESDLLKDRQARSDASNVRARVSIVCGSSLALLFLVGAFFIVKRDTALRARAEEQLRTSEEQLRLMISGVKDYAIFMLDPAGFVATWNPGLQRLKGWTAEEIVGRHFSRFYSPEEIAAGIPLRELEIAKKEGQFSGEGWRMRKDGSRFWGNVIITPVRDDDGRLLGFSKVTRDVTERRRIEQAMKQEEARLAAVIGSAMDAVITVDEKQMITLFNPAAEKMFGYPAEGVLGTSLERLMPTRFRGSHASHIHSFSKTNTTRRKMGDLTAIYALRSNGEEFPIEASISQAQIDGQKIFSVILRDMTERIKTSQALRRSDVARILALDAAQLGDWQIDLQTGLAARSLLHDQIFGYTERLAEWNIDVFLKHVHPEDREKVANSFKECLDQGKKWDFECRIIWPDKSIRWIWACGSHYKDENGKPTHVMGTVGDITERKRSEEMRLRSAKAGRFGHAFRRHRSRFQQHSSTHHRKYQTGYRRPSARASGATEPRGNRQGRVTRHGLGP
jgi:PAS domain S-box-containing protein